MRTARVRMKVIYESFAEIELADDETPQDCLRWVKQEMSEDTSDPSYVEPDITWDYTSSELLFDLVDDEGEVLRLPKFGEVYQKDDGSMHQILSILNLDNQRAELIEHRDISTGIELYTEWSDFIYKFKNVTRGTACG